MNTKPTEQEIPTPRTDALVNQRFVDHIVARAQNCMMGLGDPKTSYSLDKYADKTMECVALLLVDAHVAKYDLVSLMWAAMEEVAEHGRTLERELTLSQTKLAEVEKERDERKRQCVDWSNNHKRIMEVLRRVEQERDTLAAENARLKVELSSLANMVLDSRQNVGAPMRQKASACLKLSLAPENFPTVSDSGKEGTPETDTPETDAEAWFDNDEGWWVSISLARRLERGRNCYQAQCLLFEEERNAALRDLAAERERKSLYIMTDDNLRTALERAQADLEAATRNRCDHCGANLIDKCLHCGAPQCCFQCCKIGRIISDLAAAKDRLAKIDAAVNADAEDMAKMRDGTKLTRAGLVEVIIEQNLQLAAACETIAQVTRERDAARKEALSLQETAELFSRNENQVRIERDNALSNVEELTRMLAVKASVCGDMELQRDSLRNELSALRAEFAYVKLQRDALLDMTWLDLPAEPSESTEKWKAEFEKGWCRRDELSEVRKVLSETIDDRTRARSEAVGHQQDAEALRAEIERKNAELEWLYSKCKIVHWPKSAGFDAYPIEHNPMAHKDARRLLDEERFRISALSTPETKEEK